MLLMWLPSRRVKQAVKSAFRGSFVVLAIQDPRRDFGFDVESNCPLRSSRRHGDRDVRAMGKSPHTRGALCEHYVYGRWPRSPRTCIAEWQSHG